MGPSLWQILIVVLVILLLFGRNKLSDIMGDFGKGLNAFKKGMKGDEGGEEKNDGPTKG